MKRLFLTIMCVAIVAAGVSEAQTLRELREQGEKVTGIGGGKKDKNKENPQNENTEQESNAKPEKSGNLSDLRQITDNRTEVCSSWPYEVHAFSFTAWHLEGLEKLNTVEFETMLESYRKSNPSLFVYYGFKDLPSGMKKGSGDKPWNANSDEDQINYNLSIYFEWKDKIATQSNDVLALCEKAISDAESALDSEKLEKAAYAVRLATVFTAVFPENSQILAVKKRAEESADKCFESVKHLLTGEMHKTNIKKLVAFNSAQNLGSENSNAISREIVPGQSFYLIGYFTDKLENLDCTGHINGIPVTKAPLLEWKVVGAEHIYGRMQLYWNEEMIQTLREQSYFCFDMFPDASQVNYKSNIQYLPVLNLVKWLSMLSPGDYQINFKFSNGAATNVLAENTFSISINDESLQALNDYYKKLDVLRIAATGFNPAAGCTDQKDRIGNKDGMAQYGEVIKLTCAETGQVMKPWPNDHIVDFYTGEGYGVFKRTDGKYEIIKLEYRKQPASTEFDFFSASVFDHAEIEGNPSVKPEVLNLGYEIPQAGIEKCIVW